MPDDDQLGSPAGAVPPGPATEAALDAPGGGQPGGGEHGADATTGASVLAGGVWMSLSLILPQLYTLVISVVAARVLGPSGMGEQSFIAFAAISVRSLLSLGMSAALMRYTGESVGADRRSLVRGLLRWGWKAEAVAGALGAGALLVLAPDGELHRAWVLAAGWCALGVLHTVPASALMGLQRWRASSLISLTTGLGSTVATVAVLAAGLGITGMFAVELAATAVNLAATTVVARRGLAGAETTRPSRALLREILRYAGAMTVVQVLSIVVWQRSEFFFLERYSTSVELAIYSVAFSAATAAAQLPHAISGVLAPAIATLLGAGQLDRIRTGFSRAVRLLLLVSLVLAVGIFAVGPAALRIVYGESYSGTGPVVRIMMFTFVLLPLTTLSSSLLTGLGRSSSQLVAMASASVANVALAVALVPRHDAIGAALSNGGAHVVAGVLLVGAARRSVGPIDWQPRLVARGAVAAGAAGAVAWATLELLGSGPLQVVAAVVAGGAVLAGLVLALGPITDEDAEWLHGAVGRRLGPSVGGAVALYRSVRARRRGEPVSEAVATPGRGQRT